MQRRELSRLRAMRARLQASIVKHAKAATTSKDLATVRAHLASLEQAVEQRVILDDRIADEERRATRRNP